MTERSPEVHGLLSCADAVLRAYLHVPHLLAAWLLPGASLNYTQVTASFVNGDRHRCGAFVYLNEKMGKTGAIGSQALQDFCLRLLQCQTLPVTVYLQSVWW